MSKPLAEMSIQELEQENQRLAREQDQIRMVRKLIADEHRKRVAAGEHNPKPPPARGDARIEVALPEVTTKPLS